MELLEALTRRADRFLVHPEELVHASILELYRFQVTVRLVPHARLLSTQHLYVECGDYACGHLILEVETFIQRSVIRA